MPNDNVLTAGERNAIERAISEVELCCQFSLANELRALLAADPGQPQPRAEVTDAIAAVGKVLEANAVYFGRDKLQQIVEAARTGASS
ncbi:hypothetical protein [Burkholderia cepacia]|uniref:hypothetical protein n=1 Tax=Burkholderia cepacia TaxID=292 RepID=UPI002FE106D6